MCILVYIMVFILFLFSVLKTFIHDPLVEWEKVKGRQSSTETTNEKVMFISSSCFVAIFVYIWTSLGLIYTVTVGFFLLLVDCQEI